MPKTTTLQAWKKNEGGASLSPCDLEDPEAVAFKLQHVGQAFVESTIDFDNLLDAQEVQRALERVFEAGKRAAKNELAAWLQS